MLKNGFGEFVNWPPRTCDLMPLDYFLCGYVKTLVYVDKPTTIEALQDIITRVFRGIKADMLEEVTQI